MTRKVRPFRRADGVLEVAVIGGYGLAYAYSSTKKVTHFVENTDVDQSVLQPESYYVQLDDNYSVPEFKETGVHLMRNLEHGDEMDTCEVFVRGNDREDEPDWREFECPGGDFKHLLNRNLLIPMTKVDSGV